MGIFYGDIHYGIRIFKVQRRNNQTIDDDADDDVFLELVFELLFQPDFSATLEDSLQKICEFYGQLEDPHNYQCELLVDIFTTHDGISSKKGWQPITAEQMTEFIAGAYKIGTC